MRGISCQQTTQLNTIIRLSSSYSATFQKATPPLAKHDNKLQASKKESVLFPRGHPLAHFSNKLCTGHIRSTLEKSAIFPPGGSLNPDLDQIVDLLKNKSENVLVLAGAGLSTPSGIPDFRSPTSGIYDNLQKYKLPYAEAIFDIEYFRGNPEPFITWSKEYLPGIKYKPSIGHYFIRLLQEKGKLLRHFTQNIDGLELLAGVEKEKIVAAHGSFSTASCIYCKKLADYEEVKNTILNDSIPHCKGKIYGIHEYG